MEKLRKSEPLKASPDFTDWTGGCVWAFGHAGAVCSLAGKPESAETKTNTDPTIQYILALARTHRSDPQLCVWAVHLQTRKRLFVFPGICKHPQQKQVPLEWEENLTPSGQLHSHSAAAFDVPRTALIMKTSYTLILFNWSPDVTGCRYLVAFIFALKEKTLAFRYIMASVFIHFYPQTYLLFWFSGGEQRRFQLPQ